MNLNTIITIVLVILFFVILYVYTGWSKKNKREKLIRKLLELAEKNSCQISDYELWNKSILGIDKEKNFVFGVKKYNDKETSQIINLADFQKCRVNESSRVVSTKESSNKVVDRIDVVLNNIDRNKPETTIEIYNTAYDPLFLVNELQVAEKWSNIISDKISDLLLNK